MSRDVRLARGEFASASRLSLDSKPRSMIRHGHGQSEVIPENPLPDLRDHDLVAPHAAALSESLRAFRYELPTALADLVDNSITAGARNVWIDFSWDGETSTIAVTDDGSGMSEPELVAAMRPGSQSPLEERLPSDLGRFGLGMKTASFSQCRRVTVRSRRQGGGMVTRCWDLDHVARTNEWQLLRSGDEAAEAPLRHLTTLSSGTAVVWQRLDRITTGHPTSSDRGQQLFLRRAELVRDHLALVFHQIMTGRGATRVLLNGREIEPWDPFLPDHPATQRLPVTELNLHHSPVRVTPFVLPHHSKMSKSDYEKAAGRRGWNAHQGFYIYRQKRLLVAGDWLGFGWAKEEHYKLARIKVDFPNALDLDWSIDVTKARALPPASLHQDLRTIAERTREQAKRVYRYRGAILSAAADENRVMLWEHKTKHDRTYYAINRDHPLVQRVLAATSNRAATSALLQLIEETIPAPLITIENSEQPCALRGPFDQRESQVREVMRQVFLALVEAGHSRHEAVERLRTLWPFELFPSLVESLATPEDHD